MLNSIGRLIGQQVRISRKESGFVALYTVKQANPTLDGSGADALSIVRTGQSGRLRLGTTADIEATVHSVVLDAAPKPNEPIGVRLFDAIDDDGSQFYFIAIAPHGGAIEQHTDDEANAMVQALRAPVVRRRPGCARVSVTTTKALLIAGISRPPIFSRRAFRDSNRS